MKKKLLIALALAGVVASQSVCAEENAALGPQDTFTLIFKNLKEIRGTYKGMKKSFPDAANWFDLRNGGTVSVRPRCAGTPTCTYTLEVWNETSFGPHPIFTMTAYLTGIRESSSGVYRYKINGMDYKSYEPFTLENYRYNSDGYFIDANGHGP